MARHCTGPPVEQKDNQKPISVRALLDKAEAARALVAVLEEKKSPGIEALKTRIEEKALARGEKRGMRKGREKGAEEGFQVGVLKGREEGVEEGVERGLQASLELGRVQGREEGLEKGLEKGRELGREEGFRLLVSVRLGRPLSEPEQTTLRERLRMDGAERVADVVAEVSGKDLEAWLLGAG